MTLRSIEHPSVPHRTGSFEESPTGAQPSCALWALKASFCRSAIKAFSVSLQRAEGEPELVCRHPAAFANRRVPVHDEMLGKRKRRSRGSGKGCVLEIGDILLAENPAHLRVERLRHAEVLPEAQDIGFRGGLGIARCAYQAGSGGVAALALAG